MSLKILKKVFLIVFIAGVSGAIGYFYGVRGYMVSMREYPKVNISRATPPDKEDLDFSLFWRVWDTLHTKYYDKEQIVDAKLVYGAIRGMVSAVGDPYTVFLEPTENKVVQEDLQGTFEGVGIQIGFRGTQLAVIAPLPGSPAEEAGIEAGDYVVGIEDKAKNLELGTVGITIHEAVEAIRGPAGSSVTLTLLREGEKEPLVKDITRKAIDVPSIVVEYVGDKKDVAHIKLLKFSGETLAEWEKTVAEIVAKPEVKSIIVDVRNNPGGYLQGAIELASEFLETGKVVVLEEGYQGGSEQFKVEKIGRLKTQKLVVLINKGSASASEIFAGAIKDNKRGQIVGETSFGKGTIQEPQQINGGSGLHITIAKWLTPERQWVNEGGIKPDHELEDNTETQEDEQLNKAIEVLKT